MSQSDMERTVTESIGKTVTGVTMLKDWSDNRDVGFCLTFDDGTILEVSSRGSDEGSWVTVNAS